MARPPRRGASAFAAANFVLPGAGEPVPTLLAVSLDQSATDQRRHRPRWLQVVVKPDRHLSGSVPARPRKRQWDRCSRKPKVRVRVNAPADLGLAFDDVGRLPVVPQW